MEHLRVSPTVDFKFCGKKKGGGTQIYYDLISFFLKNLE